MSLAEGTRLGTYQVIAPLGAGGMGEVYRARDSRLQRDVAVKVLPDAFARDRDALARFTREAQAVAALSHPGILSIFDFGSEDGVAFAVTELLEGETLRARLATGPLPQRKALELAQQIAQVLAAAHEKGIVHRDLKPENLFVTKGGRIKILDFGLARQLPAGPDDADTRSPTVRRDTEPGTLLGTVGYMSPEQVRGLSGAGSPALERVLRHCLDKDPEERFRTATTSPSRSRRSAARLRPPSRSRALPAWATRALAACGS